MKLEIFYFAKKISHCRLFFRCGWRLVVRRRLILCSLLGDRVFFNTWWTFWGHGMPRLEEQSIKRYINIRKLPLQVWQVEDFQSAREYCVQESVVDRSSQPLLVLEPHHRRQENTRWLFSFAPQLEAAIRELFSRLLAGLVGLKIYFSNKKHV